MNKNWIFSILLMSLSLVFMASCDKDDVSDPSDAVTLNMLNEANGKTLLGGSGVYINKANNFFSPSESSLIADLGSSKGIGQNFAPQLTNLVLETAVTPGHSYQIFDNESLAEFPSGTIAIRLNDTYYRVYAVSNLTASGNITGAVVKYVAVNAEGKGLPAYEQELGTLHNLGESVEVAIPKGAEYYCESSRKPYELSVINGKLVFKLVSGWDESNGSYRIYIRSGSVYTVVIVRVQL